VMMPKTAARLPSRRERASKEGTV